LPREQKLPFFPPTHPTPPPPLSNSLRISVLIFFPPAPLNFERPLSGWKGFLLFSLHRRPPLTVVFPDSDRREFFIRFPGPESPIRNVHFSLLFYSETSYAVLSTPLLLYETHQPCVHTDTQSRRPPLFQVPTPHSYLFVCLSFFLRPPQRYPTRLGRPVV